MCFILNEKKEIICVVLLHIGMFILILILLVLTYNNKLVEKKYIISRIINKYINDIIHLINNQNRISIRIS